MSSSTKRSVPLGVSLAGSPSRSPKRSPSRREAGGGNDSPLWVPVAAFSSHCSPVRVRARAASAMPVPVAVGLPPPPPSSPKYLGHDPNYFRLMKKDQLLHEVIRLQLALTTSQEQLSRMQRENTKLDSCHKQFYGQVEEGHKRHEVVQQSYQSLVNQLTRLCLRDEYLKSGMTPQQADEFATQQVDKMRLLQQQQHHQHQQAAAAVQGAVDVEAEASRQLIRRGQERFAQLEQLVNCYEQQMTKTDGEIAEVHKSYHSREQWAEILELREELNQSQREKDQLQNELHLNKKQNEVLTEELQSLQQKLLRVDKQRLELQQQLIAQTTAIDRFTEELRNELKKRYGMVPSVLEFRREFYFPKSPPRNNLK